MAPGLCHGSRGCYQCDGKTAEPVDFESNLDSAESRRGCAQGAAGVRGTDAEGVHPTARPRRKGASVDPGDHLHAPGGRLLCLSEYFIFSWSRGPEICI